MPFSILFFCSASKLEKKKRSDMKMGKVIDPVLLKAVLELVNSKAGGQSEVARLCGITQKQISNYVSGKTRAMNDESWRTLSPFLRNFLPAA